MVSQDKFEELSAKIGLEASGAKTSSKMSELLDEKFKNVKKTPGVQIWRIEKLEMQEVPVADYGIFYGGDSYILMKTIEKKSGALERRIHFWLGEESSVDERGGAAIWATHLDDWFGGEPVQFRETQHAESGKFMGYFANGITYKKGGVASAFNSVKTNVLDNKSLFQVKGKRRPRLVEVDCSWDSFNEGDVFILDYQNWLIQWNGKEANRFEKLKACQCLQEMKGRRGKQTTVVVEQEWLLCPNKGRSNRILVECLGDMPETFNPASDDAEFEKAKATQPAKLYKFLVPEPLAQGKEIKQNMLEEDQIYLLVDNQKVFSWKGKKSSRAARKQLSIQFDDFLAKIGFKGNPSVEMLGQGTETATFKQLFGNWRAVNDADMLNQKIATGSRVAKSISGIEHLDIDDSMRSSVRSSEADLDDDGSGEKTVWRIETGHKENELQEIDSKDYGEFFGGDCYVIKYYNHNSRPKVDLLYFWIGANSTIDEQGAVAHHVTKMDSQAGGNAKQVRVVQGKEPPHLQHIFPNMIIYRGGTSRTRGESKRGDTAMFQTRTSIYGYTKSIEVAFTASSLNSNDAYVCFNGEKIWVWQGVGATESELSGAIAAISKITDQEDSTYTVVKEGEESDEFWEAIGGKKEYAKIVDSDAMENAKLFVCSNATGKMTVEEIGEDFTQDDLISDDVMILDGGDFIYVWMGKGANREERKHAPEIALRYQAGCPGRKKIITVQEGAEPISFRGYFQGWQENYDPAAKFDSMKQL